LSEVGGIGDHTVALRVPLVPPDYVKRRDQQLKNLRGLEAMAGQLARFRDFRARASRQIAWQLGNFLAESCSVRWRASAVAGTWARSVSDASLGHVARQKDTLIRDLLPEPPRALAAQDGGTPGGMFPGIQDVPLHIRGTYTRLGPVVPRHLPEFLGQKQPPLSKGSGRRELAQWIANPANPLTARVLVNRVWGHHFGEGIVRTPSNFGKLGELPSHPQLLDWLADRFVRDGWSLKRLHRRILLSAVYQQCSVASTESLRQDPENRWLSRMSPRRLEAEAVRDSMLQVAGRLNCGIGGPATPDLNGRRRSLYVQTARQDRSSFSTLFDAANPEQSVEKRTISTVAPQALFLLNSSFVQAQARSVAQRLKSEIPVDEPARIERAYRLLYSRPPRPDEKEIGLSFLAGAGSGGPMTERAWIDYSHVLLCGNEFTYVD
jgi:hypothetical protein